MKKDELKQTKVAFELLEEVLKGAIFTGDSAAAVVQAQQFVTSVLSNIESDLKSSNDKTSTE